MMYFTPLKTAVILGLCLLGAILCIPNLFPAPAPWLPWRTVHLGLDLRGGSYLLLEVDMKAVVKERLDSIVDARAPGAAAGRHLLPDAGGAARPEPHAAEAARRQPNSMRRWRRSAR